MTNKQNFLNTPYALFIWGLAAFFYFYENVLSAPLGIIQPELFSEQVLNKSVDLDLITTYFYLPYALMQIPLGILLDKTSPRFVLSFAYMLCALGALISAFSWTPMTFIISRFITGLGCSAAALCALKIASTWFSKNHHAFLTGLLLTLGTLGFIFDKSLFESIVNLMTWRASFIALSGIGFGLGVVSIISIRKSSDEQGNAQPLSAYFNQLKHVLAQPLTYSIAFYGMLVFTPYLLFIVNYGSMIIDHQLSYMTQSASQINTLKSQLNLMLPLGFLFGSPILGWYSDHIGSRVAVLRLSAMSLIPVLLLLSFVHLEHHFFGFALFAWGFLTGGFLPSFSLMKEVNPSYIAGTSMGVMNMFNMILAFIFPLLIHFVQFKLSDANHISIYLLIMASMVLIAYLLTWLMSDRPLESE